MSYRDGLAQLFFSFQAISARQRKVTFMSILLEKFLQKVSSANAFKVHTFIFINTITNVSKHFFLIVCLGQVSLTTVASTDTPDLMI
jgi:hypothetical protein